MNNKEENKVCIHCKRELPKIAFSKSKNSKDGLQGYCKECATKYRQDKKEKENKKKESLKNKIFGKENDMNKSIFIKIKIYFKDNTNSIFFEEHGKTTSLFDKIRESKRPEILVNINNISSLEEETNWGCKYDGYQDYPYRKLFMNNGDCYICVLESANELEKILINFKNENSK